MRDNSLTKRLWRKLVNEREAVGRRGRENGGGKAKKAGCPGERAAPARPNGRNDDAKGPGRLSRRGSLRRSFGPFGIVAGVGRWSRKIKSLNDRRLVASLKSACVQPEGSRRKISQARGVKTKKRFYIWSTSGWGSGERGRKCVLSKSKCKNSVCFSMV